MAANSEGTIITTRGLQLITKLAGARGQIEFTNVKVGTGRLPVGTDPAELTHLITYKMDGMIAGYGYDEEAKDAYVVMQIVNEGIESGFIMTEVGLYAKDPDLGEILYAYVDLSNDPNHIMPAENGRSKTVQIKLHVIVGEVTELHAVINPLSQVTREEFDRELKTKVTASGGDITDTVIAGFTDSTAQYPVPAPGDTAKVGFGKIKKFFEDIRNTATGACFIGQIVNNCVTDRADLPLSAAQGKGLMELCTKLNSDIAMLNSNLEVQSKTGIDILTLSTGRYYVTNSTNLPPGWIAAYLDVERLDSQWCRITAWPPYEGIEPPCISKQCDGIWKGWVRLITNADITFLNTLGFDIAYDTSTNTPLIRWRIRNNLSYQLCVNDNQIFLDRWDGATWSRVWTK